MITPVANLHSLKAAVLNDAPLHKLKTAVRRVGVQLGPVGLGNKKMDAPQIIL